MGSYDEKPWLRWYDDHVSAEIAIPDYSYLEFLEKGMSLNPENVACHFLGTSVTYRELNTLADRFARFLVEGGCGKGDVVGINLPNTPQYLAAMVGTLRAGCVISGVSPLLSPREIVHQANDSGAKVLLTLDALLEHRLAGIADQIPALKHVVATSIADHLPFLKRFIGKLLKKVPSGKIVPLEGKQVIAYNQLMTSFPAERPTVSLTPDDTCLLQYTGGTTGPSKGVVLTHRNVLCNYSQTIRWFYNDVGPEQDLLDFQGGRETVCSGFPFFHIAGLCLGLIHLAGGNTQVLIPDPRNTHQICSDVKKYRPTQMSNVPTLYQMIMENPAFSGIDFSQLRECVSGAAPFDVDSIARFESFVGQGKVVELYGMTETSPMITINPVHGKKKIGSVGVPIQSTRIKIVDVADAKTEMPIGEPGELIVSGPQVMKEYHGNPEATRESIEEIDGERYLHTGDVARMDEDGFVYIVDRTKDMLLVGGFNVYSKQVEETLYEIPEIEFCAIVGEPHPERPGSEIVKAVIQLKEEEKGRDEDGFKEKILSYCRENMAPYCVPKIVAFIDEIPLTAVGKVDKKALRK